MSFVALNGVPAHADPFLRDLVKANAGPGAIIESDYDAIYELYGGFGYASSPKEAALRAFSEGGVHIDLCSLLYLKHLPELVEEGRVGEEQLLARAAEMLTCKERVGLLDDPYRGTAPDRTQVLLAGPATAYRDLAQASVVLLRPSRPDPAVLPIPTTAGEVRLCVLGPLAHEQPEDWLGAYSSHANHYIERVATPLTGLRKHWPQASYARGCDYDFDGCADRRAAYAPLREAAALAREATHAVLFLGEPHKWSGELATLAEPRLPYIQRRLVQLVRRANRQAKLIVFITAGRALHIPREVEENADAIFWTAHLGTFAGMPSPPSSPESAARPRGSRTDCRLATGSPPGSTLRQARVDRPAVPVVPGSVSRRQRHHWCAYYLGLGARWPAAYYFGEGYGFTTFELSDWSLSDRTLSASAGAPITASVRVTNTGTQAGTERCTSLPGYGVRGAGPAPAGAPRPSAGNARSGRTGHTCLLGGARDAGQVRAQSRGWPAGLA